jgi:RNA polymerase sigma-70 factor, ECF subfamily
MPVYLEDKKLVKQLLAGDERAFAAFFEDNFARLYRFASARLPTDLDATAEVVQNTLGLAVRKLHTYRAESALFTWLCTICRHEISDWLHRHHRYRDLVVLMEDSIEVRGAVESLQAPARMDPEQHYRRVETLRLIQVALDQLPPRYGDVLEWKYIEGHSVKDIALRLEIGSEAAQSLLARAKRAFADAYQALGAAVASDGGWVQP